MFLLSQNLQCFFPLWAWRTGVLMLECCCWELPSCKQPFHYFMEASFATISAGHSAKSAFLDSTVTPLGGPSSSGLVAFFFWFVFKLFVISLQF